SVWPPPYGLQTVCRHRGAGAPSRAVCCFGAVGSRHLTDMGVPCRRPPIQLTLRNKQPALKPGSRLRQPADRPLPLPLSFAADPYPPVPDRWSRGPLMTPDPTPPPSDDVRPDEATRQSEEHYRLLVESVKDYAIFLLDPQGRVATWNIGAERIK